MKQADSSTILGFQRNIFGLIYFGFSLADRPVHIWLLFILYGVFMAMTEGVQKAYLATIIPRDFKATGFGLYNTLVGLAVLPASVIGGLLWDRIGPWATFLFGTATSWLAALLFCGFLFFPKAEK